MQEFSGSSLDEWKSWYLEKHPEAIKNAAEKISAMVELFKDAINKIDKTLIEEWVTDLVIVKTFVGLRFQEAILKKIAESQNLDYRLATPEEESKGIDGFIGTTAVSIKPVSYKTKSELVEKIDAELIYYSKVKNDLEIEFNF
ncbi:MAG: MjaI family restriction endonuclease [Melioribacter sp.]|nr:MjaI family restriction endonuclease [Melioribacter sp.]